MIQSIGMSIHHLASRWSSNESSYNLIHQSILEHIDLFSNWIFDVDISFFILTLDPPILHPILLLDV